MQIKEMLQDNNQRALPPGNMPPQTENTDILARLEALEKRVEALEKSA